MICGKEFLVLTFVKLKFTYLDLNVVSLIVITSFDLFDVVHVSVHCYYYYLPDLTEI